MDSPGVQVTRRFIVVALVGTYCAMLLAPVVMDVPLYMCWTSEHSGFLSYFYDPGSKLECEVEHGMVMDPNLPYMLGVVIGFYFGNRFAGAKR
jgi:hypothetical protein